MGYQLLAHTRRLVGGAKLEVGTGLDAQVVPPRQDEMFGKAIRTTSQSQLAGDGLVDIQVRVRGQPRLDGRCGRQRGRRERTARHQPPI